MKIIQEILFYLFLIIGSINFLHLGLYIIGANIYDINQFRRATKKSPKKKATKSPLVSLVIPAYNEEVSIRRCLNSIRRNTYRKIEVFVHNDNSSDETAKIVRDFKKRFPQMKLRLVTRRKQVGKAHGVNYCIKKYAKGELIMTLDADCLLDRKAIKNAVDYFDDDNIVGVAANVKLEDNHSILGLLQQFEHLIGYRSKKFYSITNCEFIVGGVASTYRASVLKKVGYYDTDTQTEDIGLSMKIVAMAEKHQRIIYAADVLATTDPVLTFNALRIQRYRWKLGMIQNLLKFRKLIGNTSGQYSKMLTLYRLPMAFVGELTLLMEPIIVGYILYVSIVNHTTVLFIGAYLAVTIYVLLGIWPDEHMRNRKKISQSIYAPVLYFIFYIMDLVQILAIFKVLANPSKMLRRGNSESNWTPPPRVVIRAN